MIKKKKKKSVYFECEFWISRSSIKAAKYEIQKPSTWRVNIVSLQVWVDVSRFSPCMIILLRVVAQQICSCTSKSTNQRVAFLQPATNVFVAGQVDHAR